MNRKSDLINLLNLKLIHTDIQLTTLNSIEGNCIICFSYMFIMSFFYWMKVKNVN